MFKIFHWLKSKIAQHKPNPKVLEKYKLIDPIQIIADKNIQRLEKFLKNTSEINDRHYLFNAALLSQDTKIVDCFLKYQKEAFTTFCAIGEAYSMYDEQTITWLHDNYAISI